VSLGNERESFTSSLQRTRGAERIALEDAERSAWLDATLAAEKVNDARRHLRVVQGGLAAQRRSNRIGIYGPRGPLKPRKARHATQTAGTMSGEGEGI
jgi:hypothetical protein